MKHSINGENNIDQKVKVSFNLLLKRFFKLILMCTGVIGVRFIFNSFELIDRLDFFITIAFTIFLWIILIAQEKI